MWVEVGMTSHHADRFRSRSAIVAVLALVVAGASACGDDDSSSSDGIPTALGEWFVQVATPSAAAGEVTFAITNEGDVEHEFLVVRTDAPSGSIPLDGDQFSEDEVEVIDEVEDIGPGESASLTVDLEQGDYELVCNLPGHYASGMYTSFSVTEGSTTGTEPADGTSGPTGTDSVPGSTQPDIDSGGVGSMPAQDDPTGNSIGG
jgi:uncharacterized cupredoxin-like copper-binding protein